MPLKNKDVGIGELRPDFGDESSGKVAQQNGKQLAMADQCRAAIRALSGVGQRCPNTGQHFVSQLPVRRRRASGSIESRARVNGLEISRPGACPCKCSARDNAQIFPRSLSGAPGS